ncbi:hypothetical protein CBS9595_002023 [Malassezia furfur]|nr:hypothetical protein CBS9595_002023 [Malassezia furfur]
MAAGAKELAVFEPGRFEALYAVLQAVAEAAPHGGTGASDWYIQLERSRAVLANLGQVCGKRDTERREMSQGKIVLEGHTQTLNADFVAQSLLLSDALNVSEVYAASLLQEGIHASARWARPPTDVAVLLHYREKLALLACLKELTGYAYTLCLSDDADTLRTGVRIGRFVDALAPDAELVHRIVREWDALHDERAGVQRALQSAPAGPARLSDEIQLERLAWIAQAEQELGHVVYMLALSRRLAPAAIEALLAYAARLDVGKATSAVPVYVLTALLAALDTTPDAAAEWLARHAAGTLYPVEALCEDAAFLSGVHKRVTGSWASQGMRRVVLLSYALLLLHAIQRSPSIATQVHVSADAAHALVAEAIAPEAEASESALLFLLLRALLFQHRAGDALDEEAASARALRDVDVAFQEHTLQQVEHLVLQLTATQLPLLRKLQRAEEDAGFAALRGARPGAPPPTRRYDIEALLDLIALLCKDRPDAGVPFWLGTDRRMSRFLHWALDMREPGQQRALLDMLAALATGEQCAGHAHAMLEADAATHGGERRLATWARLFDWIAHYVELFRTRGGSMPPEEMVLLRAFLQLLATVVQWSAAARDSLYLNSAYMPLARLFALYACPVPVDLKAALLHALGAFAAPVAHVGTSPRILAELWDRLQQSGVLQRPKTGGAAPAVLELEHTEATHFRYPGSTELVRFLTAILPSATAVGRADALVHATHALALVPGGAAPAGVVAPGGVPAPLLHSSAPYVAYVVDDVFLKASQRMYATPAERWEVSAACLDFFAHCLADFPLAQLLDAPLERARLTALVRHPGFALVQRVLSGTPLLHELFFFLHPDANSAGFEAVNGDHAQSAAFAHCVRQTLQVLLHLFRVQHVFMHVLCPALADAGGALAAAAGGGAAYMPLDVHLLHAHQVVVQIALYANCTDEAIAYLGVRALAAVARSATFQATDQFGTLRQRHALNRLVGIIEMTGETERVRGGLLAWLEVAAPDVDVPSADALADIVPETERVAHIQRAVLDVLLEGTAAHAAAPNVAHLLLGFDLHAARDDDRLVGEPAMLRTLRTLVAPPGGESDAGLAPLTARAPVLAEHVLHVLRQLCVQPYTSAATLRYLRTHGDFFVRHVDALPQVPAEAPTSGEAPARGTLTLASGAQLTTSAAPVLALLRTDAHVLQLAALDVRALALRNQLARALPLVRALLGVGGRPAALGTALEVVRAYWSDARDALAEHITLTTPAALVDAQPVDAASGPRVYDVRAVAQLLLAERQARAAPGAARAEDHATWLAQAAHVLQWAAAQNTQRAVAHARREALHAWRDAVGVVVAHALPLLHAESRAAVLLDAVHAALPLLGDVGGEPDACLAELAASGVLVLLRALEAHDDAEHVQGAPPERAIAVLRALLDALLRPGTSGAARMDLYLSVVCFAQLSGAPNSDAPLAQRTHALLAAHMERLVEVVARDALDASDVGQTVALATLARLVRFEAPVGKRGASLTDVLVQRGYLRSLVLRLETLDGALQDVLSPDPTSLNAQYVYEALVAFLCRIAQTRAGAQQLVDAHLFRVVARADFLSLRPDPSGAAWDAVDDTGFLPAAAERYAALLTPLLHLVLGVLQHLHEPEAARRGASFTAHAARTQALALLAAHQDALLAVLRAASYPDAALADAEQAALLVEALATLLPGESDATLDALHTAVLTLAATYVGAAPAALLAPHTPAERDEAAVFAPTLGGLLHFDVAPPMRASVFDTRAIRTVHRVVRAVAQYLERASAAATRPTLVPTLTASRADGGVASGAPARIVAAPTFGAAVAALSEAVGALSTVLQSWERVHTVLRTPESVRADEWAEIARELLGDDVAAHAPRPHVTRALQRVAAQLRADADARLDTVELLLVLLVRHVRLWDRAAAPAAGSPVPAVPPAPSARTDAAALRAGAGTALLPLLEKIELLPMVCLCPLAHRQPDALTEARAQAPFLHMAARTLADGLLRDTSVGH